MDNLPRAAAAPEGPHIGIAIDPPVAPARAFVAHGKEVPGLTGLRFLAAFAVTLAHAAAISLRIANPTPFYAGLKLALEVGAGFGMTLFFVLSGFVIHYNYSQAIRDRRLRGIGEFLWARFSRLYPLFLIVMLADILLGSRLYNSMISDPNGSIFAIVRSLPYYLTFTQSWVYKIIEEHNVIYQIGNAAPVTWSISTEWFFYLCYPAILLGVVRAKSVAKGTAMVIAWSVLWATLAYLVSRGTAHVDTWAIGFFGPVASASASNQDSFVRWLQYFSPYMRIGEFVLGCMTAQVYMLLRTREVGRLEKVIAWPLLAIAVLSIPALTNQMYWPDGAMWIKRLSYNFGLAPSVALLILCTARHRLPVLRFLDSRLFVRLGEASYSIYLTHLLVFAAIMEPTSGNLPESLASVGFQYMRLVGMVAVVLLLSVSLYRYVENPARRALRRCWSTEPGWRLVPGAIAVMPFLLAGIFIAFGYYLARVEADKIAASTGIMVRHGSYGANCGAPYGNVTDKVRQACDGRSECSFVVDVAELGDPMQGCGKAFSVEYVCAPHNSVQMSEIPGEAGFKSVARLKCDADGSK